MRAYIAGPLFNEGERWFNEQIEARAMRAGLTTYLPQRDSMELVLAEWSAEVVYRADVEALAAAAIVIANLNGVTVDAGTAWELGYAYASDKHVMGIHTDMRVMNQDQVINLMIGCSLHKLVRSLDALEAHLRAYVAAQPEGSE